MGSTMRAEIELDDWSLCQWIDIPVWQNLLPQRTNRSGYRLRMAA
jgi:hypothetical protein